MIGQSTTLFLLVNQSSLRRAYELLKQEVWFIEIGVLNKKCCKILAKIFSIIVSVSPCYWD